MKTSTKLLVITAASSALLLGGGAAATRTKAAETAAAPPFSSLVDKIATKFNLNKSDVQAVFDQDRTERHAEMQRRNEEELAQAVTDGKITAAQKELILAKQKEITAKMEENHAITDETQRRAAMEQLHADLTQWAADNNIDAHWLRFGGGRGKGMGAGGGFGHGMRGNVYRSTGTSSTATN